MWRSEEAFNRFNIPVTFMSFVRIGFFTERVTLVNAASWKIASMSFIASLTTLKSRMSPFIKLFSILMMSNILQTPSAEVINYCDFETFVEKSIYKVAADNPSSTGHENPRILVCHVKLSPSFNIHAA